MKGHTITGTVSIPRTDNSSIRVLISGNGPSLSTISIQNGTIARFDIGVFAGSNNASGVVGNVKQSRGHQLLIKLNHYRK